MSTGPYMTLITDVERLMRRDFYVADATILNPVGAAPLLDGEWLELDSNYKLVRGSGTQDVPAYQVWAERGRYDTQAIGKVTVLFAGPYEAETTICDLTSLAMNSPLMVADVTVGGATKRGLKLATTGEGVFAWVTRLPGGGKVRYRKVDFPTFAVA